LNWHLYHLSPIYLVRFTSRVCKVGIIHIVWLPWLVSNLNFFICLSVRVQVQVFCLFLVWFLLLLGAKIQVMCDQK